MAKGQQHGNREAKKPKTAHKTVGTAPRADQPVKNAKASADQRRTVPPAKGS